MKSRSSVLVRLAELYEESFAGRHGGGQLDFQRGYEELLGLSGCGEGEMRELAERDLRAANEAGVITLVPIHPRDPHIFVKVRLAPENEPAFFAYIGVTSPTARRSEWVTLFHDAKSWQVPEHFADAWRTFCTHRADAALSWRRMKPFDRNDLVGGRELLALLPRLLTWDGCHLVRWVSSIVCGDSKFLERRQKTIELLLAEATGRHAETYESLGILPVPPSVTFHGSLRLQIGSEWRDFRELHGPMTLSGADVKRITAVKCEARRCLTVENATPFRSLATLRSGELLIHTSYPSDAALAFLGHLKALPSPPEFWHFGDTDPTGFHILADIRKRSGIAVRSFQMAFRAAEISIPLNARERHLIEELIPMMPEERTALNAMLDAGTKGDFEQEGLKPPSRSVWPFYG